MIAILGAGISGISASYHLNLRGIENIIFEKKSSWGGLCDNFTIGDGFRFDYFVHLSFTKDDYVKKLFNQSSEYILHNPISTNYYKGIWLKHPAQNNLSPLSTEEKTKIIIDFVNKTNDKEPQNYYEWLLFQFGEYFTNNFPGVYTKKYWTAPSKELTIDWLSGRFSIPSLENILKGAFEEQDENFYYAQEMRYPKKGGYKSFLNGMASECIIEANKEIILIDLKAKRIDFSDNSFSHYEELVSSIPLPELVKCIKDVPQNILDASEKLLCTSGQLVSLGFNRPDIPKNIWFYIYDEDIIPARAYSPSIKSPDNVPFGKSSLQFETYYSKVSPKKQSGNSLIEHIVNKGNKMKLWSVNDIEVQDYREVKYANVVFNSERNKNVSIIHDYLKSKGIYFIGRFGEWDYLWSDQSLLSGKKITQVIVDDKDH
jgi:protoporphyrinogen oxidase